MPNENRDKPQDCPCHWVRRADEARSGDSVGEECALRLLLRDAVDLRPADAWWPCVWREENGEQQVLREMSPSSRARGASFGTVHTPSGGTCGGTRAQSQMASTWSLGGRQVSAARQALGTQGTSGSADAAGAEASHGSPDDVEGTQGSQVAFCVRLGRGSRQGTRSEGGRRAGQGGGQQ